MPFTSEPPQVLTIAGSDPSGGAGIQADLKTFASFGCYGMAVVTALTAQNTQGVSGIHIPPAQFFRQQVQAILDDVSVDAIKIGMLGNEQIVRALSEELKTANVRSTPIVLDPVMVSTSGSLLLTHDSIHDLITLLLPRCTLLTPNVAEAEQLLQHANLQSSSNGFQGTIDSLETMMMAAQHLSELGPEWTLIKGGHRACSRADLESSFACMSVSKSPLPTSYLGSQVFEGLWNDCKITIVRSDGVPHALVLGVDESASSNVVVDVLFDRSAKHFTLVVKARIDSTATHGTGCTLSSACAAALCSIGETSSPVSEMVRAVYQSIEYVQGAISRGLEHLGAGNGPLNHIGSLIPRPILAPVPLDSTPLCSRLIAHSLPIWEAYTQHSFVQKIASLTLPSDAFIYFLRQDYLFLKHYARVWASGASSFTIGSTFERIGTFAGIAAEMAKEAENHVEICKSWGITKQQLELETPESAATLAYTRFVLDISRAGDVLELLAATGPCLLGYGEAARWILKEQRRSSHLSTNFDDGEQGRRDGLMQWVQYYNDNEFQAVVKEGIESMERYASEDPPSVARIASLQRIWDAAVRLEIGMWDEALDITKQRMVLDP